MVIAQLAIASVISILSTAHHNSCAIAHEQVCGSALRYRDFN
ncbi:MAG: hypothetical protein V7K40_13295 [Nostoc sp.]